MGAAAGPVWGPRAYLVGLVFRTRPSAVQDTVAWWARLMRRRKVRQEELRIQQARGKKRGGDDPTQRRPA